MIASVSGSLTCTVVPAPISVSTVTLPPIRSMFVLTTSMPTPRPLTSVTFSAVEKPGRKISPRASRSFIVRACSGESSPRATAFCLSLAASMPPPSSLMEILTLPAWWKARSTTVALAGLPAACRCCGDLDAVIDGIAHEVRERVADGLDDRLVEFHFRPFDLQFALLAQLGAQVANDARKAVEDRAHHLHAGLHDRLVQVGGHLVDAGRHGLELGWSFAASVCSS